MNNLNKLKNNIYKTQFHEEDEHENGTVEISSGGAKKVLESLQNLKKNPLLLNYVLKCLASQEMFLTSKHFYITVYIEYPMPYNEKIHKNFETYKKFCIDGDFHKTKEDIIIPEVFNNISDAENFAEKYKNNEKILFELYSINEIGKGG